MLVRSFKCYGLFWFGCVSLAAVYMNHYTAAVKPFYLYSMVDLTLAFGTAALANAWLYPRFFPAPSKAAEEGEA